MKKSIGLMLPVIVAWMFFAPASEAQHVHGGMQMAGSMKMETKEVLVEGLTVFFTIMENAEHKKMLQDMKMEEETEPGTTHNITVALKDAKTGEEVADARVTMKVIDPQGKDQVKALKYEDTMKSHDAYFSLSEKGPYQVLVLVKIGEKKISAGIYYEIK